MPRRSVAGFVLALACCSLHGQQLAVDFDTAKTKIDWILAGNVHTIHGTFRLKEGRIFLDQTNGTMHGDVVADATSGQSGNGARDRRMNREILESARFREVRLTPKKVEGAVNLAGTSTVRLSGTFLIHGTAHEITIPVDLSFSGASATGTGKFSIPYVDWGMKDPSNFLFKVDKSVDVEIIAVGTVKGK